MTGELLLLDATTEEELVGRVRKDASRSVILRLRLISSGYEFGDTLNAVFNQLKQRVKDQQTNMDLSSKMVINYNILSRKDQINSKSHFCCDLLESITCCVFSESAKPAAIENSLNHPDPWSSSGQSCSSGR